MTTAPANAEAPGTDPAPAHAPGLDLLRAVAVIWVMLFHSFIVGGLGPDFDWLSRYGWMGVDIFFVLSGYLIGTQVLQQLQQGRFTLRAFYARRAWRILPAFAVVLLVYACAPALREAPGLQPAWQFATFTFNLWVDYGHNQAFSHAWSLCVEEHFYLVFPVLALALRGRASARRVMLGYALLVLGGIALRAGIWLHFDATNPARPWFIEDLYYPTWTRLDGLLVGLMLASLRVHRPQTWARLQAQSQAAMLGGLLVCAIALWLFRERTGLLANTLGWPVLSLGFGLLVFAAADRRSWIGRWRVPGMAWVAGISYSLYLSHKLAFHAVQQWLEPGLVAHPALLFMVYVTATMLLGAALHHGVERPGLRWRDRRSAGRGLGQLRKTFTTGT